MPTPKKVPTPTVASIARRASIARSTLMQWQKSGINIFNERELQARIGIMPLRADTASPPAAGESYQEAKRRRAIADANRAEVIARREAGILCEAAGVEATGYKIGLATRQGLDRLADSLPPALAGQDAAAIAKILKACFRELCTNLADSYPQLTNNHDNNTEN